MPEPRDPAIPPLVTMGHPRLAQPSEPVPPGKIKRGAFQERLRILGLAMVEYEGVGIAAPQVGWFERFFLMRLPSADPEGEGELLTWVNPEIVTASPEHNWAWEGCLSVPGLRGWIRRPAAVAVRGLDAKGRPFSREFTGWPARVFQHEFDHLDGMLFPYRAVDPHHLISTPEMAHRENWPDGWPAPGARDAEYGTVVAE